MRKTIQAALALSCALALAVGGSAVVNAQDGSFDTQIPARFTATLGEGVFNDQTVTTVATVEASDPRISGTWNETKGISVSDLTDGAGDVVTVWWHDVTIVNGAGSWVGHSEGFGRAEDWVSDITAEGETIFLVGGGAYEGLTATLLAPHDQDRGPGSLEGGSFEGVIFPSGWNPVAEG
jgi:hypothetical protein